MILLDKKAKLPSLVIFMYASRTFKPEETKNKEFRHDKPISENTSRSQLLLC